MSELSSAPPLRRRHAPTLADVARLAGVSTSTAGRVLRDEGWPVEASLREKVLVAAAELAYVPNVMARTLRAGSPALVGLVIGNMLDPYYGEIGEVVTRYSIATNKMLAMVCNMQREPKLELEYCRRLWEHRVAGLVLAGGGFDQFTYHDELAALLTQMEHSGVVVTTLSPRDLAFPCFSADSREVGRMAAMELIALGHRHVAILSGPMQNRVLIERVGGMVEAFDAASVDHFLVHSAPGSGAVQAAMAATCESRPDMTACVAASSMMSVSVIQAIEATGRRVPDDISVIGIGSRALGEGVSSRLTHVDLCLDICSRAALDHIAGTIGGISSAEGFVPPPRLSSATSLAAPR